MKSSHKFVSTTLSLDEIKRGPGTGDDPGFFTNLIEKLEEHSDADISIVGGDFNLVLDPEKDRLNSIHNPPKASNILKNYIEKAHLVDSWRIMNPDQVQFSWSRLHGKTPCASRIDLLLIPEAWANKITESEIQP